METKAGSFSKKKTGEVLAVLGPEDSIQVALEFRFGKGYRIPKSAVKAQDRSSSDRYLVKVQPRAKKHPGATRKPPVYYAPLVSVIDGKSESAAKRRR